MKQNMPTIDLTTISRSLINEQYVYTNDHTGDPEACNGLEVARRIIATQGINAGRLRASKPNMDEYIVERNRHGYPARYRTMSLANAASAQVWRYVAFSASPNGQHHCMPVMATFDCPIDMTTDRLAEFSRWCQRVADIVLTTIPMEQQHGLKRWTRLI